MKRFRTLVNGTTVPAVRRIIAHPVVAVSDEMSDDALWGTALGRIQTGPQLLQRPLFDARYCSPPLV